MILAALIMQVASVTLPYSWLEYCARSRDPGCVVETIRPLDLAYINKLIAETITTEPNTDPLDPWEAFPASRRGDCDDHTVTARAALIALGVPASSMRIELGEVTEPDGRTVGHAVLVVTLDGLEWVMDRRTPDVLYPPTKRPYAWRPLARQSSASVVWQSGDLAP